MTRETWYRQGTAFVFGHHTCTMPPHMFVRSTPVQKGNSRTYLRDDTSDSPRLCWHAACRRLLSGDAHEASHAGPRVGKVGPERLARSVGPSGRWTPAPRLGRWAYQACGLCPQARQHPRLPGCRAAGGPGAPLDWRLKLPNQNPQMDVCAFVRATSLVGLPVWDTEVSRRRPLKSHEARDGTGPTSMLLCSTHCTPKGCWGSA